MKKMKTIDELREAKKKAEREISEIITTLIAKNDLAGVTVNIEVTTFYTDIGVYAGATVGTKINIKL